MPATYQDLLRETSPQVIENEEQYAAMHKKLGELLRKGHKRNPEETKLYRLLALLIEDYDRRHALPQEESTSGEKLRYLLEVSGKAPSDLTAVFGQRSHVNEALNDKRPISAVQARKLGELFRLKPGYFL